MWQELQKLGCPVTTIEPATKTAIAAIINSNIAGQLICLNTFIPDVSIALVYFTILLLNLTIS